jgi:UDP-N-acetylglucosamine 1-carboxyvinyltransferase
MSSITIEGGRKLVGEVTIRGAKNSVSKIMVASLLTEEPCILENIPNIQDVEIVSQMIKVLGGKVEELEDGVLSLDNRNIKPAGHEKLRSVDKKSRIPILFAGPLLGRFKSAFVPELGGCEIGPRPVDFHIEALEKLGAKVERIHKGFHLTASRLKGTKITLNYPSVGATEQVLLSSVLAEGETKLSNAAVEPEIADLISVLQKMGAIISVDTNRSITIVGVSKLNGFKHKVIPDRLEAESWACAAVVTSGKIFVRNAQQSTLMTFLNKYRQVGGGFKVEEDGISFWREEKKLRPINIETNVYPGFSTDWQQPFTTLLTQAQGESIVHETVYENRFGYTETLNKMGANIKLHKECLGGPTCRFGKMGHLHSAVIVGPTAFKAAEILIPDLRAGFSYVIAALAAQGSSKINNIELIQRGYENFIEKLTKLGAKVSMSS